MNNEISPLHSAVNKQTELVHHFLPTAVQHQSYPTILYMKVNQILK